MKNLRASYSIHLMAFIALLMTAFVNAPDAAQASNPKNVILIGLDTVRWDHTSLFDGANAKLTPNIQRLAERGTVFTSAISQAPWTLPAFASIMTGKYPHEHMAIASSSVLGVTQVLLSEILKEAGYTTGSQAPTSSATESGCRAGSSPAVGGVNGLEAELTAGSARPTFGG